MKKRVHLIFEDASVNCTLCGRAGESSVVLKDVTCPVCLKSSHLLHPDDVFSYVRTRAVGLKLADSFRLKSKLKAILPCPWYWTFKGQSGFCAYEVGIIWILFRRREPVTKGGAWGEPFGKLNFLDTLCHELAHLRHFDHSEEFYHFADEIGFACAEMLGVPEPEASETVSAKNK